GSGLGGRYFSTGFEGGRYLISGWAGAGTVPWEPLVGEVVVQEAGTSPVESLEEEEGTWSPADWGADRWAWEPELGVVAVEEAGWERPWVADTLPQAPGASTETLAWREADKWPWAEEVVAVAGPPWAAGTSGVASPELHSCSHWAYQTLPHGDGDDDPADSADQCADHDGYHDDHDDDDHGSGHRSGDHARDHGGDGDHA
ncbi:hypothetical protein M5D96_005324, partial [Drosophila gunungcola]